MLYGIVRKLSLIVPLAVIVFLGFRPTPILGVDGESLAASVGVPVGVAGFGPCEKQGDEWRCVIGEVSSSEPYLVDVDWLGCWAATPEVPARLEGQAPGSQRPVLEGCVTIADHVEAAG
jgi:hypothetical protein